MKMSFCIGVCVDHVAEYNVVYEIILSMKYVRVVVNSFSIRIYCTVKFIYNFLNIYILTKDFQGDFT